MTYEGFGVPSDSLMKAIVCVPHARFLLNRPEVGTGLKVLGLEWGSGVCVFRVSGFRGF